MSLLFIVKIASDRWSLEFRPGVDFATKTLLMLTFGTGFGFEGAIAYRFFMPHLAAYAGWSWNHFAVDKSFAGLIWVLKKPDTLVFSLFILL
ncbi:MAG: hypothetical protein MZV64_03505 [Ignavibacteriales bacterium]|nr:hypothetical protein [Ignavibacteriales bacterium]